MVQDRLERHELKYFVRPHELDAAREMLAPFMQPDPYARRCPDGRYTVRSIYFDTPDLRFYHEKLAGIKVRKKLRVRTYNCRGADSIAFFEIKRKVGNAVRKERVRVPYEQAVQLLDPQRPSWSVRSELEDVRFSHAARATLERFFFLMSYLRLRPTVLVIYDREPFVGRVDPRSRVTFDCRVRSAIRPEMEEIFAERDLRYLTNRKQILELKFDRVMPQWLRPLTRRLNGSHRAISKYCHGIDLWDAPIC